MSLFTSTVFLCLLYYIDSLDSSEIKDSRNWLHSQKAYSDNITELEMTTDLSDIQPAKVAFPIFVTLLGISIGERFAAINALSPMLIIVAEKVIDVRNRPATPTIVLSPLEMMREELVFIFFKIIKNFLYTIGKRQ